MRVLVIALMLMMVLAGTKLYGIVAPYFSAAPDEIAQQDTPPEPAAPEAEILAATGPAKAPLLPVPTANADSANLIPSATDAALQEKGIFQPNINSENSWGDQYQKIQLQNQQVANDASGGGFAFPQLKAQSAGNPAGGNLGFDVNQDPGLQDGRIPIEIDDVPQQAAPELVPQQDNRQMGNPTNQYLTPSERFRERQASTQSEAILTKELSQRRNEIQQREDQLVKQQALLTAAERQLIERQRALEVMRDDLEKLLEEFRENRSKAQISVLDTYKVMKPKAAARIFNELPLENLVSVVQGLSPRTLAPIMAEMTPEKARELTNFLTGDVFRQVNPEATAGLQPAPSLNN